MAALQFFGYIIFIAFAIFVSYCTVLMIKDLPEMFKAEPVYEDDDWGDDTDE